MINVSTEQLAAINADLSSGERRLFAVLLPAEKPVSRAALRESLGDLSTSYIDDLFTSMRRKLKPHFIFTKVKRNKGWTLVYDPDWVEKPKEENLSAEDARPWRASHIGDPLLDALREHHTHGLGNYA